MDKIVLRLEKIEKNQERILALLHKILGNVPSKEWGTYEDARKIIARSKDWYKSMRNGNKSKQATLVEGKHWRRVGKDIEYHLPSINELKELLSHQIFRNHKLL